MIIFGNSWTAERDNNRSLMRDLRVIDEFGGGRIRSLFSKTSLIVLLHEISNFRFAIANALFSSRLSSSVKESHTLMKVSVLNWIPYISIIDRDALKGISRSSSTDERLSILSRGK